MSANTPRSSFPLRGLATPYFSCVTLLFQFLFDPIQYSQQLQVEFTLFILSFLDIYTISSVILGIFLQSFNDFHHITLPIHILSVPIGVRSFDSQVDIHSFYFIL
jgi:hypothetical protein